MDSANLQKKDVYTTSKASANANLPSWWDRVNARSLGAARTIGRPASPATLLSSTTSNLNSVLFLTASTTTGKDVLVVRKVGLSTMEFAWKVTPTAFPTPQVVNARPARRDLCSPLLAAGRTYPSAHNSPRICSRARFASQDTLLFRAGARRSSPTARPWTSTMTFAPAATKTTSWSTESASRKTLIVSAMLLIRANLTPNSAQPANKDTSSIPTATNASPMLQDASMKATHVFLVSNPSNLTHREDSAIFQAATNTTKWAANTAFHPSHSSTTTASSNIVELTPRKVALSVKAATLSQTRAIVSKLTPIASPTKEWTATSAKISSAWSMVSVLSRIQTVWPMDKMDFARRAVKTTMWMLMENASPMSPGASTPMESAPHAQLPSSMSPQPTSVRSPIANRQISQDVSAARLPSSWTKTINVLFKIVWIGIARVASDVNLSSTTKISDAFLTVLTAWCTVLLVTAISVQKISWLEPMENVSKETKHALKNVQAAKANVWSVLRLTSWTDFSNARRKIKIVKPTPTESARNVRINSSFTVRSVSLTLLAASNTAAKIALNAGRTMSWRMVSVSTGKDRKWIWWEVTMSMTSKLPPLMWGNPNTTSIISPLPQPSEPTSTVLPTDPAIRIVPFLPWKGTSARDGKLRLPTPTSILEWPWQVSLLLSTHSSWKQLRPVT